MNSSRRKFLSGVGSSFIAISVLDHTTTSDELTNRSQKRKTRIIGHRGCSATKKDNSMKGIKCAVNSGADGVEIDVQKTKDNYFVLSHDPYVFQGNKFLFIESSNLSELQEVDDRLILLKDALDFLKPKSNFDIHIDLKSSGISKEVLKIVKSYNLVNSVIFQKWFVSDFVEIKNENIRKALVSYYPSTNMVDKAKNNNIDAIIPHYTSGNLNYFIKYANRHDIECGYWAINDTKEDVLNGINLNPNFMITNRPHYAYENYRNN